MIAKILANFSIAALMYWAVGFAFAFGVGDIIGHDGFFLRDYGDPLKAFPVMGLSDATIQSKWFFQFVFCAVSLAIVWGTTLERIKFGVYLIYAVVFAGFIYPIASHWVFGGGWLQANLGMQDFAGSTAVHLIGATGALAVLLLLGPRRGKYGKDGKPRAIPGHNMPLFGLGVLILWLGWFGFNPGSTLGRARRPLPRGSCSSRSWRPPPASSARLLAASGRRSRSTSAWRATARSPRSSPSRRPRATWSCGPRRSSAASPASSCRCASTRSTRRSTTRWARSRRTASPVSGARSPAASSPRRALAEYNGFGDPGLIYTGSFHQLVVQALGVVVVFSFVFALSYGTFWAIKKTYGLRVSAEEEDAGLDISEHGMYGYPEQFIPAPELVGYATAPGGSRDIPRPGARPPGGPGNMKKVEAFVRHEAFEPIRTELLELGFPSLSISEVKGSGRQKGITERYRGAELTNYLRPKVKVECVVASGDVQTVVDTILKHARTGSIGDGKVFVMPVEEAYRIRTGESGEETLQAHPDFAAQANA